MTRIDRLTPDQKAFLPVWRDKWIAIGLSTEPADRPRAERGIRLAYEAAGLQPPKVIVWCNSPMTMIETHADANVGISIWDAVRYNLRDSFRYSDWDSLRHRVWDAVRYTLGASFRYSIWAIRRTLGRVL